MEKCFIEYDGKKYSAIEVCLNMISDIDSDEIVLLCDLSLWDVISKDYYNGVIDAIEIDDRIYFYCDYGFLDSINDESELIEYMKCN